jgi:hypothetical protein
VTTSLERILVVVVVVESIVLTIVVVFESFAVELADLDVVESEFVPVMFE